MRSIIPLWLVLAACLITKADGNEIASQLIVIDCEGEVAEVLATDGTQIETVLSAVNSLAHFEIETQSISIRRREVLLRAFSNNRKGLVGVYIVESPSGYTDAQFAFRGFESFATVAHLADSFRKAGVKSCRLLSEESFIDLAREGMILSPAQVPGTRPNSKAANRIPVEVPETRPNSKVIKIRTPGDIVVGYWVSNSIQELQSIAESAGPRVAERVGATLAEGLIAYSSVQSLE